MFKLAMHKNAGHVGKNVRSRLHWYRLAVLSTDRFVLAAAAQMSLLYAAGLSLSSSSDNFAVGVSLGLSELSLPVRLNAIVAVANAAGALVATHGGQAIGSAVPTLAPALASLVFGYLAWDELGSWTRGESASPLAKLAAEGVAVRLAVPMTLNNLAGGLAGGVAGVAPSIAFAMAFVASFVAMLGGHVLGRMAGRQLAGWLDARLASGVILTTLALAQAAAAARLTTFSIF